MIEREEEIVNRLGLHARAAAKLVNTAGRFQSRVTVTKDGEEVDAKSILGVREGIMRLRGKWLSYRSAAGDIPTLATLHPAFLLRNSADKRLAWRDLLLVKKALETP